MSWIKEIHSQPRHIREILFGLSVITTISLVGIVWIQSFKKDFYALLNPEVEQIEEQRQLAEGNQTLFGNIFGVFGDLKASFMGVIKDEDNEVQIENSYETERKARVLPIVK